jgi:hypothetical protein
MGCFAVLFATFQPIGSPGYRQDCQSEKTLAGFDAKPVLICYNLISDQTLLYLFPFVE